MMTIAPFGGFGLGLRRDHYADFLDGDVAVDFVEVISENFMIEGGRPLRVLEQVRAKLPVILHGVSMSIGSAHGLEHDHLARLKALADRIEPLWVSDHLCWTRTSAHNSHDLLPLPLTRAALSVVCENIERAQDALGRPMLFENPSSYLTFPDDEMAEWEFLAEMSRRTGCHLLLDINNIYVSARNHGFDPAEYLAGIPANRVRQLHLAGHTPGEIVIDTHDRPVCDAVWDLYAEAMTRLGPVAVMIERDDAIPPLPDLLAELDRARMIAATARGDGRMTPLRRAQEDFLGCLLDDAAPLPTGWDARRAAGITVYRNAYRARLVDVLRDTFQRTAQLAGDDAFRQAAAHHLISHPPAGWTIDLAGERFAETCAELFANDPDVAEVAWLEWAMQRAFTAADGEPLTVAGFAAATANFRAEEWDQLRLDLLPGTALRPVTHDLVKLWAALGQARVVSESPKLSKPGQVLVWREGERSVFVLVPEAEGRALTNLQRGGTFGGVCEDLSGDADTPDAAATAGAMLLNWLELGVVRSVRTTQPCAPD